MEQTAQSGDADMDHELAEAAALLDTPAAVADGRFAGAAKKLRALLAAQPEHVATIQLLLQIEARLGEREKAAELYARLLELAPEDVDARADYAELLLEIRREAEASRQLDILLERDPRHPGYLGAKANALMLLGDLPAAIAYQQRVLEETPGDASAWVVHGNTLRIAGQQQASVAAYRKAIALKPGFGEAWWRLADLKTFHFTQDDIEAMNKLLETADLTEDARFHIHFALGKSFEDQKQYAESFQHYRKGNTLRRASLHHDPDMLSEFVRRMKALFTREFFESRKSLGCPAPDPIFVVGRTRSGSTLIEQMLASHSAIEGTRELPVLMTMVRRLLAGESGGNAYAEIIRSLDGPALKALGEEYLEGVRAYRTTAQPFLVDKMPGNFHHLGFIHLILPNARIVDVRRHPLGCCFSNFKQLFDSASDGSAATYDLVELGRYYRDYVELMAHFDAVLPGRVHRVFYEDLVRDPEQEIRRLLAYCDLPFDESCLRFHETKRSVHTVSSEQVRRPIYQNAVQQWRHYEPWLNPLKKALGPVLTAYPAVPDFA